MGDSTSSRSYGIMRGCGQCEACLREDCGVCTDCVVRKKKDGGDGSSQQPCIKRRCLNLQYRADDDGDSDTMRRSNGTGGVSPNGIAPVESSALWQPFVLSNGESMVPFCRPVSLIRIPGDASDPFRAENMDGEPNHRPSSATASVSTSGRKRPRYDPRKNEFPTSTHFAGLPVQKKIYGACGKCGLNEEELDDTIILCDGPGCDQEFHLQCCIPPLSEVPSGSFYCFDCSQNGSTALLQAYLDEMEEARESYQYKSVILTATCSNRTQSRSKGTIGDVKSVGTRKASTETSPSDEVQMSARSIDYCQALRETPPTKDSRTNRTRRVVFVDHLLWKDVQDSQPIRVVPRTVSDFGDHRDCDGVTSDPQNHCSSQSIDAARIPRSELDVFHQEIRRGRPSSPMDSKLVGKCLRLYCPRGNDYHHGRILSVLPSPDTLDTECLVRFPAGRDHRKSSLTRWLRLEEHSLAVATQLAWGLFSPEETYCEENPSSINDGKAREGGPNSVSAITSSSTSARPHWLRAQIWMRTSRELVNVMPLLREELGQIRYRSVRYDDDGTSKWDAETLPSTVLSGAGDTQDVCTIKSMQDSVAENTPNLQDQEWGLAEVLGRGSYQLLNLSTETTGIETSEIGLLSRGTHPPTKIPSKVPRALNTANISSTREAEIASALEEAELSEQARVEEWNFGFRLRNPWHKSALTLQDEFALRPLNIQGADYRDVGEQPSNRIQPTPLVRPILDRIYLTNQLDLSWEMTRTKDVACSLSCGFVHSLTAFIQNHNLAERRRVSFAGSSSEPPASPQVDTPTKEFVFEGGLPSTTRNGRDGANPLDTARSNLDLS